MVPRPISNPPNPWLSTEVEYLEEIPPAELEVYEEEAKRALAENESPDVGFRWSLNPYRGCFHACSYCYARSSHQYLGFGAGTTLSYAANAAGTGGTLTVSNGAQTDSLALLGQYAAAGFQVGADQGAGTIVTYDPNAVPPPPLTQPQHIA